MNLSLPENKRLRFLRWFDFRSGRLGMLAYILNRVTAIGLVVYLYLHLAVLSMLAGGASNWDPFIQIARAPLFLTLDVILLAGILIHGLNGVRVTLTGFGVGVRSQKLMFIVLMLVGAIALIAGAFGIFAG